MLAAKVGKIHKARIRHRTESGVEPQFLVLLLVLSSCGGDLLTSDIVFRYFKRLVSHVLRFIQKVTLPKIASQLRHTREKLQVKDSISAETYTRAQVLGMEKAFLKKLEFRLAAPTPYVLMLRFLKAAQSETKLEHLAFYLIELYLVEYEPLRINFSDRCLIVAETAEMVLRFHKAARGGSLKVTYEKYSSLDLRGVAAIKPLETLPLRFSSDW
ncbi:hypothetical protein C1H46_023532 [Malus baccata]|uniref:Cyclin C-terminal domain-containing protein n=1 Tax=Malus baccata TaxID=106549 RepID=A0A540LX77_MALBA|nr:hypothetical protein C1H46_023532 [Malus baccata]